MHCQQSYRFFSWDLVVGQGDNSTVYLGETSLRGKTFHANIFQNIFSFDNFFCFEMSPGQYQLEGLLISSKQSCITFIFQSTSLISVWFLTAQVLILAFTHKIPWIEEPEVQGSQQPDTTEELPFTSHLLAIAKYLIAPCNRFLIYKINVIIIPMQQGYYKGQVR